MDEDAIKERNRERLEDQAMMVWTLFMAASMAGGARPDAAAKAADSALNLTKARFT